MPGPWRQVELIEDYIGVRGGQFWYLTLECGHTMFHPKRSFSIWLGVQFAPQKKRCRMCSLTT